MYDLCVYLVSVVGFILLYIVYVLVVVLGRYIYQRFKIFDVIGEIIVSECFCLFLFVNNIVNIQIYVIKIEEVFFVVILKFCWICFNFLIVENEDKDEIVSDVEGIGDSGKIFQFYFKIFKYVFIQEFNSLRYKV